MATGELKSWVGKGRDPAANDVRGVSVRQTIWRARIDYALADDAGMSSIHTHRAMKRDETRAETESASSPSCDASLDRLFHIVNKRIFSTAKRWSSILLAIRVDVFYTWLQLYESMFASSSICPCLLPRCAARVATTSRVHSLHTTGIALHDAPRHQGFERYPKDRYTRPAEGSSERSSKPSKFPRNPPRGRADQYLQRQLALRTVKREPHLANLSTKEKWTHRERLGRTTPFPSWSTLNSSKAPPLVISLERNKSLGIPLPSIRYILD